MSVFSYSLTRQVPVVHGIHLLLILTLVLTLIPFASWRFLASRTPPCHCCWSSYPPVVKKLMKLFSTKSRPGEYHLMYLKAIAWNCKMSLLNMARSCMHLILKSIAHKVGQKMFGKKMFVCFLCSVAQYAIHQVKVVHY